MVEPLTLVIVEDEEAHFSLMKRSIAKEFSNASIYHFQEPNSCFERIDDIKPTIIITDYLLPGMSGVQFLERLNQKNVEIPVIMVTGQGDENIAAHAMKLGAKDYLVKSGNFFALLPSIIEKVIHEQQLSVSLRETEAKYRLVVENADEGILVMQDGEIKFSNPKIMQLIGCFPEEKLSGFFHDFVHAEDRDIFIEHNSTRQNGVTAAEAYDFRIIDKQNDVKWLRNNAVLVNWDNRPATLNFLTDITDRKRDNEQILYLRQKLMESQENERHMISRELHDSIAQDLSSLKIGCETLFDKQDSVPDEMRQKISAFSTTLNSIIRKIRDLSYLLNPLDSDQLGIVQAISQYCNEISEKTPLTVNIVSAGMEAINLNHNTKINLYRITQEGLNNIKKHAEATQATVKIVSAYPNIFLTIQDNGKGFDVKTRLDSLSDEKRMGLQGMRERTTLLGGKLSIQSYPGKGTKIAVKIPFKQEH